MYEQLVKSFEKVDLRLAAITLLVVIIHGSFGLLSFIEAPKKVIKNKPLFVSTISLMEESEVKKEISEKAAVHEKESPKEEAAVKPVAKTPPKKETIVQPKKVTPIKKEPPKPITQSAPKKETSFLKKDKLKEAKERMAKVNSQTGIKKESLSAPPERKSLGELNANKLSDLKLSSALSHKDEVALVLKSELKLPEYGEVEISLTLKSNGQLVKMDIVKTKSEVNSLYIKEGVSHLKFPPSKNEANNVTYLFTLTNE